MRREGPLPPPHRRVVNPTRHGDDIRAFYEEQRRGVPQADVVLEDDIAPPVMPEQFARTGLADDRELVFAREPAGRLRYEPHLVAALLELPGRQISDAVEPADGGEKWPRCEEYLHAAWKSRFQMKVASPCCSWVKRMPESAL